MRVKQRVIVEKEFLKPQNISEEKWINHWKKNSDKWGNTESDFYDYHQETYASDVEILETTFVWNDKSEAPYPIEFTDEAIDNIGKEKKDGRSK